MDTLGEYVEFLRQREEGRRGSKVALSTVSSEADLSANMAWRIVRDNHVPKPETLQALAEWAGRDRNEVAEVYREMMRLAGYGTPAPALPKGQRRVLDLIEPLTDEQLAQFVDMLERFTVVGLTKLMSGAEEEMGDNWPPILTVVLSPTERDLLRRFRALPLSERDVAAERMQFNDDPLENDVVDFARLLDVMIGMSVAERSSLVRRVLLEIQDRDSKTDNSRGQGPAAAR